MCHFNCEEHLSRNQQHYYEDGVKRCRPALSMSNQNPAQQNDVYENRA
jgi:hypothetical protein